MKLFVAALYSSMLNMVDSLKFLRDIYSREVFLNVLLFLHLPVKNVSHSKLIE